MSPLRFDVLVRARFLEFLGEHEGLVRQDLTRLVELARSEPYFRWFQVEMQRYRPNVAADPAKVLERFELRVRRTAALWRSYLAAGFDRRRPVVLRVAAAGTVRETTKPVSRPLHLGDGCHRTAMLLASGVDAIPPELYRIDAKPLPKVIDNTSALLRDLQVTEAEYAAFLALAYAGGRPATTLQDLVDDVASNHPEHLPELHSVIEADRALLFAGSPREDNCCDPTRPPICLPPRRAPRGV